jgi:hypothetical protein
MKSSLPQLIYTHNPFYLVSAFLVLLGLHRALGADGSVAGAWWLIGTLAGYTLLLAIAGLVIVRLGQVWDDARTILLAILLLFVALSISFDKIVLENPSRGAQFLVMGFLFAVAITEMLFAGLGLRLGPAYRIPYYLLLALMFVYPVALGRLSLHGHDDAMAWGVFLFPMNAALVFLTLWTAAGTSERDEPPNCAPWSWPWYPWSIFLVLLLAICLRSYSLSMAFESGKGAFVSFQPYFLSPIVLAVAVLLLHGAIANNSRRLQLAALLLPLAILAISLPGKESNPVAHRFLNMLVFHAAAPLQLALIGVGAFYALAWLRGCREGEIGVIGCLVLDSWVDSHTTSLSTLASFHWLPLAAVACLELVLGSLWQTRWRLIVGSSAASLSLAGLLGIGPRATYRMFRASPIGKGLPWLAGGVAALTIALVISLAKCGCLVRDGRLRTRDKT